MNARNLYTGKLNNRLQGHVCMSKFRLAVINTQPPHLYFGGVERRIIETTRRLTGEADITVYSGTKAGFKTPTEINGVRFVPCNSTDKIYPLDNWSFNKSIVNQASIMDADVFEAHNDNGYRLLKILKQQGSKKPFVHTIHGVLADEYEQAKQNGYANFRGRVANQFMRQTRQIREGNSKKRHINRHNKPRLACRKCRNTTTSTRQKCGLCPTGLTQKSTSPKKTKQHLSISLVLIISLWCFLWAT